MAKDKIDRGKIATRCIDEESGRAVIGLHSRKSGFLSKKSPAMAIIFLQAARIVHIYIYVYIPNFVFDGSRTVKDKKKKKRRTKPEPRQLAT